jgi:hypothetical protein
MRLLIILLLLFAQEPPYLAVVAARDTVYPGQLFSVTVTSFGDVGAVAFDSGGLEVITDTQQLGGTRYVWLRASGPARDVRVRASAQGISSEATIRICCKVATWPGYRLWLASVRR